MTIKIIPEECIPPERPEDLPGNAPWPPTPPIYPLPHRIWTIGNSKESFNKEIAIKHFGENCVQRVLKRQPRFTGDVWLLSILQLTVEACQKHDKDCENVYRFS